MHNWPRLLPLVIFSLCLISTDLLAQPEGFVPTQKEIETSKELKEGWNPEVDLELTGTVNSNERVIGQQDGTTLTFGSSLDSRWIYFTLPHEWRQTLNISESVSKMAGQSFYTRNADELTYESLYLYKTEKDKRTTPYLRLAADTSIFKGVYQTEEIKTFVIEKQDGQSHRVETSSLRVTDPWRPLTLKQSLGALANLSPRKSFQIEARLGLGAQQVLAKNQLVVDDQADTQAIEVREVNSYSQAGLELAFSGQYRVDEKTSVKFSAESLIPYLNSESPQGAKMSPYELMNTKLNFEFSSRLSEWLSLKYEASAKKQPQILDAYQIQQNLLFSATYSLL